VPRVLALVEVLLCSDVPTQLLLIQLLTLAGYPPLGMDGQLAGRSVWALLVADAVALVALIFFFLRVHGERPRDVFIGRRRPAREALLGFFLVPIIFVLVVAMLWAIQHFAPFLHNVPRNPLENLIRTRTDAVLFAIAAILAGGVREEVQRAFILHRFEQHLGGAWVGLVVFSVAFGAGHLMQGRDAAIVTGVLGALWGSIYLIRRSVIAPAISHAGFNTAEIVRHLSGI